MSGCASSYRVVQVPQYGADLYPQSQSRSGVTVAIDELKTTERVERLFGADLIKEGILPVNVVVSNFGKQRMVLKPSDILLHQGKDVIDPIPVELVMATAKRQKTFLRSATQAEVDKYFAQSTFKETTLFPNETYRGVMFFAVPAPEKDDGPVLHLVERVPRRRAEGARRGHQSRQRRARPLRALRDQAARERRAASHSEASFSRAVHVGAQRRRDR